jgi:epoxyqueuosine reductase
MTPDLTGTIKREALRLGFHKVGVAKAGRLENESRQLEEWLSRGYHGTMKWMQENSARRADPSSIVPGAKSVIAVAMNYYADVHHDQNDETGKISRYAWGDDYHDVLTPKLHQLLDFIRVKEPSANGKAYVDTGPVMDKVWAQRAGLGWEGKHTNIITQEYGSWVFLGEIIIDIELEYDQAATDHCGSCTLCIEACPTDAIAEPYVVDSNRCISYLTIEHRGEIAEELGEKFDRWIYGCDICQDVCPWNEKFAKPAENKSFYPREGAVAPGLREIATISEEGFREKFRKSPVKRAKHSGLVRNAKVILNRKA